MRIAGSDPLFQMDWAPAFAGVTVFRRSLIMSFHAYVANEGGKDNPLNFEAWLDAARKCDKLTMRRYVKRNGQEVHEVYLDGKRKRYLWFTKYGLIHTQNPSEEMMHVLFFLANELNAGVYNGNFKRYASVLDWDRKTRHERERAAIQEQAARKARLKKALWLGLLVTLSAAAGWLLGEYKETAESILRSW